MVRAFILVLAACLIAALPVRAEHEFLEVPVDPWGECQDGECCDDDDDDEDDSCRRNPCARIVGAWSGTSQPRVDLYVSQVINTGFDPTNPGTLNVNQIVAYLADKVLDRVDEYLDEGPPMPHQIDDRDIIAQVDVTWPEHEDPDADGFRFTFQVDVLSCIGE